MSESTLTEYRFNGCGHRTSIPCGPPPVGTFRIVLVGSSLAEGLGVPVQQTFATELPVQLSRLTGRKIDLYNEAMQWGTPRSVDLRFHEVLAAKPNLVVWAITPFDIENVRLRLPYIPGKQYADDGEPTAMPHPDPSPKGLMDRLVRAYRKNGSPQRVTQILQRHLIQPLLDSRAVFLIKHVLYASQSLFLKQYLMEDDPAGFLKRETPQKWQERLNYFDGYLSDVSAQLKVANVPLVIVLLPHRSQAAMVSMNAWPSDYDPYRLGDQLKVIAQKHGAIYVDILHDFQGIPNPDQYYLPVDGHMNASGHEVISKMIATELTAGAVPELKAAQTSIATNTVH